MDDEIKMPISFYLINTFEIEGLNFDEKTDAIIKRINNEDGDANGYFKNQKLDSDNVPIGTEIKVFFAKKPRKPRWSSFFADILDEAAEIKNAMNIYCAFIVFVSHSENIFAAAGGVGNFSIGHFAVPDFGMQVLSRIIKKDHKVIKGIQDRGVTGNILGQTKFYRGDQRFSDEDQFGKIYKQVKAELNKEILMEVFGFSNEKLKRKVSGCLAHSSFRLNKRIGLEDFLNVASKFSEILNREPNFILNNVIHVSKRDKTGEELIKKLENHLVGEITQNLRSGQPMDFDLCHKNFEIYLTASQYIVSRAEMDDLKYDTPINISTLVRDFKDSRALISDDEVHVRHSFLNATIRSINEEGETLTRGSILTHLNGQVNFDNAVYFFIDEEWYRIQANFLRNLNLECRECVIQLWDENLIDEKFDLGRTENYFNQQFLKKNNFLVFDTITEENIEFCDLLAYNDTTVHLIHVKKGFNNSIRELTSQIVIAAKRIQQDIKSDFSFIDGIERKIKKGRNSNSEDRRKLANQAFPAGGLKSIFQGKFDKDIIFCLAFVDTSNSGRTLKEDLDSFNSSIAKFSLLELRKAISSLNFGLKIIQIKNLK